jgi:cobaltochelatase CobT
VHRRTLAAVAACTRTLGGAPDTDAEVPYAEAVTLGRLRAAADRAALRRRWHDGGIHAAHRPAGAAAGALYDALEQARLDGLGAQWLAGVALNLLAHPGLDDDGVRWLAFAAFTGLAVPRDKAGPTARARAALSPSLQHDLGALAPALGNQRAFAPHAAAWCTRAAGAAPVPEVRRAGPRFDLPSGPTGVDVRRGRHALPGRTREDTEQAPQSGATTHARSQSPPRDPVAPLVGYRVYTTAFDRVVDAAALASAEELAALRTTLDTGFAPVRGVVSRMAKRLMRVLMARQVREWRFDQEDGLLEPSRLPVLVASRGAARPFKQEVESPFPSTVVTLLIDHSGSMAGRPMQIAALTVEVFARVLERCGVRCEVLGFTTRDWDGGEPARTWADDGYPPSPGRLNALEHIVIKAADVPWRRARRGLGLFLRDGMLKENVDGEALTWAHQRLLTRTERRRILIVVSDGTPMDEATVAANGYDYLDGHLAAVVEHIETRSPVRLAAIGIGHDVSQFYRQATRISKVDDLGPALTARLLALLGD